jgi:hypothetical protein
VRLLVSSAVLGLIWFGVTNIAATLIAYGLTRATVSRRLSAGSLLTLRLMPAALSTFFVAALFLPAHLRYEPAESDESFGIALASAAGLSLVLLGRGIVRAVRILRTDIALSAMMRRRAKPHGTAFEVHGYGGVSLAGILRPRIFIGSSALAALTPAELDVAISHEIAHRRSLDNVKRFLISCAPDVFGLLPIARRLEDRWEAETECQADALAVRGDTSRAVMLASALVKVARLPRPAIHPAPLWSGFHAAALLETRVRRLVDGQTTVPRMRTGVWSAAAVVAGTLALVAWTFNLSYAVHVATEALVIYLP